SGLDRRLPQAMGRVNRNKVPHIAVLTQAVITTIITVLTFIVFSGNPNLSTQVYLVLQAAVTVIWCLSMVMLFVDVLVIRSKFPTEFKREQLAPSGVFVAASVAGAVASGAGIWVTLTGSWNPLLIANGPWLLIVGGVTVASLAVAVIVYLIGVTRKTATLQPSTFVIAPYAPHAGAVLVDMITLDGMPYAADGRAFLKRMIVRAAESDLTVLAAFEPEWTLATRVDGIYQQLDESGCFTSAGMNSAAGVIDE